MKKAMLLLLPIFAISLTSCGVSYADGKFFSASLLKKQGIADLPKPEGKLIREMSNFDNIIKTVYVQNETEDAGLKYAQSVFDYLRGLSYKHFYSVKRADFLLTWELSKREINSLEDCKYQDNIHIYYFFVSNSDFNEDNYIEGLGVVVKSTSGHRTTKKRDFHFDFSIKLDINKPWSFRYHEEEINEPEESQPE